MITIIAIPKAFIDHNSIIQKNAIRSWQKLEPMPQIVLFGTDVGVEVAANEFGVRYVPSVERNEFGTPLLSSTFCRAQEIARNDVLVYANADIIILQDLIESVRRIDWPKFMICGRRWDLDVNEEIDFSADHWAEDLLRRVRAEGVAHSLSGIDYFVFRRNTVQMPPFAVGRPGWDGWLIGDMRRREVPVIDTTEAITVIHQNHDYSHSPFGESKRVGGPEWAENIRLAGGLTKLMTLRDANWVLTKNGLRRPAFPGRIHSLLSLWYPWRLLLAAKRKVQK